MREFKERRKGVKESSWGGSFPGVPSGKEPTCHCWRLRDIPSIPGLARSFGGGFGNPLQCSCLENPGDRGAWRAIVHRVTKSHE